MQTHPVKSGAHRSQPSRMASGSGAAPVAPAGPPLSSFVSFLMGMSVTRPGNIPYQTEGGNLRVRDIITFVATPHLGNRIPLMVTASHIESLSQCSGCYNKTPQTEVYFLMALRLRVQDQGASMARVQ